MIPRISGVAALALFAFSGSASAAMDVPSFFANGQIYAESQKDCIGSDEELDRERPIGISKDGIFGHESGCDFIEFKPVQREAGSSPDTYVITASCGDDSGITRPDFFNISMYDDTIQITSQNDYLYDLLRERGDDDHESWGFVNKQYVLCEPK